MQKKNKILNIWNLVFAEVNVNAVKVIGIKIVNVVVKMVVVNTNFILTEKYYFKITIFI